MTVGFQRFKIRPYSMANHYKETVLLPKTDFPMKAGLTQREPELLARWEQENIYARIQQARKDAPLFVLHDGPPFANGDVHMGTGLNKILKDLVVKSKTMAGFRAPFIPGWDCHGLPIEFKVVKESGNLKPVDVRQKSEAYARKYIDVQRGQFKRLGIFADWENPYLTLSPAYEAEIIRSLADFVEKGLVYRSKRPVFWSTGAQTALAEAEVEYEERVDDSIYVAFPLTSGPLEGCADIVIWTTTPWTLPANVAIAVHPRERYVAQPFRPIGSQETPRTFIIAAKLRDSFLTETKLQIAGDPVAEFDGADLEHWKAAHPLLNRTSSVVLAEYVTMDSGTGCVHTAPGHGTEDYLTGLKYNLPLLSPVDDHGRFTDEAAIPALTGIYVFDANQSIIAMLASKKALIAHLPYPHPYPHCWRSKTPVIFRSVEQFFIKIDALRDNALRTIDKVQWLPVWGRNRIASTVAARPDWCISRQRTWGVPLPVFYDANDDPILDEKLIRKVADIIEKRGSNYWFETSDEQIAKDLRIDQKITRRLDTIDVWIDSGVSHRAVCRRHPELAFPADLYLEATDQHRGWFQSSLLTSIALTGEAPFRAVLTHGFVVDTDGKKFSKSGAYQKPTGVQHFVNKYGADLVRLWVSSVNFTDEVPFSESAFEQLGETYRRLRNTLRILLANLYDFEPAKHRAPTEAFTFVDCWILHELQNIIRTCRDAYESFEFHRVHHTLNSFCAVELSSLYIDITKDRLYCDAADSPARRATQTVMHDVFGAVTRLLAPILAFTAEEAWGFYGIGSVHEQLFPEPHANPPGEELPELARELLTVRSIVSQAVEVARQQKIVGKGLEASVTLTLPEGRARSWIEAAPAEAAEFFIVSNLNLKRGTTAEAHAERSPYQRCERCWRHLPDVGNNASYPDLCARCAAVVHP